MKKILLLAVLAVSLMGSARSQDIVNLRRDASWQGLRGNVATLDEDVLIRKDYFREDWPSRKWFRDDLRNCLREDNGRILTFNNAGRLLTLTYTQGGVAGKKTTCSYSSKGLLTSFVGEGYKFTAKYEGSNADINIYAEGRKYGKDVDLQHADLGNTPFSSTYAFDMKCKQELGDNGLVITSRYCYVDSMPARTCTYSYNHRDQLEEERIMNYTADPADPQSTIIKYTYDNNGFLAKKSVVGTSVNETYLYQNNEQGDCEQLTIQYPYSTVVYTYEYVYDDNGNWTRRLQFKDGVFENATLRTITYHHSCKANKAKSVAAEDYEGDDPADRPAKAKTSLFKKNQKAAKADKPVKEKTAKADKPAKEKKVKADKPVKEKTVKADKPAKEKKAKADKPVKEKKAKADKTKKDKKSKSHNTPDELK